MIETNINRCWNFKFGENIGDENGYDCFGYAEIGLPHSFGIPYYGTSSFYVGYGCYQKTLNLDKLVLESPLYLEFGAVFQVAEIFINGKLSMRHEGGYTAFICEIGSFCKEGDNNIFVRVNNNWSPIIAPRAGEHTFNGGIYRDVKLISYPTAHIAWYGTFVRSYKISDNIALLTISTETKNCVGRQLHSKIINAGNNLVAESISIVESDITIQKIEITNPTLWDTQNPYLYCLKLEIATDSLLTSFGIRYIEWSNKGFFLNGSRVLIQGANVHQDHGGWGDAVAHSGIARDISMMKECGFNFIRGSHYPHHTEFSKECDRQGMLFWSESVFWGIGGFGKDGYWDCSAMPINKEHNIPFEKSLKNTLAEMIKTNRNSPSIICWSMGNEMFFSERNVLPEARSLVRKMVDYSHQLDSSRPAGVGGVQRGGFDIIGDVAGYNGDGAVLFKNPPKPNLVAEYGSIASYRPGKYDLYETSGSDEYYDWRAGRCIWCGFHHGSIAEIGNLGIVDLYRLPLRAWYAYRERLMGIAPPKFAQNGSAHHIRLSSDRLVMTNNGTEDCFLVAQICDEDGEAVCGDYEINIEVLSGGGLLPTGRKMIFNKELKNCFEAACAIEIRGYYAGETIIRATSSGLISAEITLNILGPEKYADNNLQYPYAPQQLINKNNYCADIVKDRPVSVSSEQNMGSCLCLTAESKHNFWAPCPTDGSPFVILDLETSCEQCELIIKKPLLAHYNATISSSIDRSNWLEVDKFSFLKFKSKRNIAINQPSRYLKITFKEALPVKVKHICVYKKY